MKIRRLSTLILAAALAVPAVPAADAARGIGEATRMLAYAMGVWAVVSVRFEEKKIQAGDAAHIRGGLNGSGFFIDPRTFVTAHHVLTADGLRAAGPEERVSVVLFNRIAGTVVLHDAVVEPHPEREVTLIRFPHPLPGVRPVPLDRGEVKPGSNAETAGFFGNVNIDRVGLAERRFWVQGMRIQNVQVYSGRIDERKHFTIQAKDIAVDNLPYLVTNFSATGGLSGAPLFGENGGVVGVMSFLVPVHVDDDRPVAAVPIDKIIELL